jgi:histidinol-phosphate aminotransferase
MQVEPELLERVRQLALRRDEVLAALRAQGWRLPVSQGNFVWLPTGPHTAAAGQALAAAGIMARVFPPEGIRVSIGERESVASLVRVAGEVVRTL